MTGRSSGEKAPLTVFRCNTEPGGDWFDGNELVRDWSDGIEFDWLCEMDDTWSDVFELFMDSLAPIKVVGE